MKILMILHSHDCGGAEMHALSLMKGLREQGHQIVFAGPIDSWLADAALAAGISCEHLPMHGFFDLYSLWRCTRLAKSVGADLLHGHLARGAHYAGLAGRWLGLPVVATAHSTHSHKHFRRADRIIAVSKAVKDALVAKGYAPERLRLVYHGLPAPKAGGDLRSEVRAELGLEPGQFACCMVARFVRDKGQDLAIEALKRLVDLDVRLFLIGKTDGAWFATIRQLVDASGLADRVRFLGHRDDIGRLLVAMDAYLAPSRREALGLSILEACAAGLPIAGARVGGIPEIVRHGENGWLFESEDVDGLVNALRDLVGQEEQRRRFGVAARATFDQQFSLNRMIAETEAVYGDL